MRYTHRLLLKLDSTRSHRHVLTCTALALLLALVAAPSAEALYYNPAVPPFPAQVPVCWDSTPHPDAALLRKWTLQAANSSWAKVADLSFKVISSCATAGSLIDIQFLTSGTSSTSIWVTTLGTRAKINLVYNSATTTSAGFKNDAIRQLGQALGFVVVLAGPTLSLADSGDEGRVIVPPPCSPIVPPGAVAIGKGSDPESILNNCAAFRTTLSPWDIVGVQLRYGRKRPGSLLGPENLALQNPNTSLAGTATATVKPYLTNLARQRWEYQPPQQVLNYVGIATVGLSMCLQGSSWSPVKTAGCTLGVSQQFKFERVEIRGIGEKCLAHDGSTPTVGALVKITSCSGAANQKWTVTGNGQVRAGTSGLCLDAASASSGQLLKLKACGSESMPPATQTFLRTFEGKLKRGSFCVDSQWADPINGRLVQLYTCKSATDSSRSNQLWHLTGALKRDDHCLTGAPVSGAEVKLSACTYASNQTWDYYFY